MSASGVVVVMVTVAVSPWVEGVKEIVGVTQPCFTIMLAVVLHAVLPEVLRAVSVSVAVPAATPVMLTVPSLLAVTVKTPVLLEDAVTLW